MDCHVVVGWLSALDFALDLISALWYGREVVWFFDMVGATDGGKPFTLSRLGRAIRPRRTRPCGYDRPRMRFAAIRLRRTGNGWDGGGTPTPPYLRNEANYN